MTPGAVSVAPISETPDRMALVGQAAMSGTAMLSPFCRSRIAVCDGVTAGAMSSETVGWISGQFFVETMIKSYSLTPSPAAGIRFSTIFVSFHSIVRRMGDIYV
jgi:hypothetical protein